LPSKRIFFTLFLIAGFITKIVSEIIHEVFGHGILILLFGGEITSVHISLLWPYEISSINWILPSSVTATEKAWVYASGILVCLSISFLIQVFLFWKRKMRWHFAVMLFWLAFWTFANSTGYLLIGGLAPFGDVSDLIELGVFTSFLSRTVGFMSFCIGFVNLSWILRRIMTTVFALKNASLFTSLFWLVIPLLVMAMLVSPERNLPTAYLPLTFLPALASFVIEYFLILSKQRTNANPNNVAKK